MDDADRWFVTSRFYGRALDGWDSVRTPTSTKHAKTFGTDFTSCGARATGWVKFFERPFVNETVDRCPQCVANLQSAPRHG